LIYKPFESLAGLATVAIGLIVYGVEMLLKPKNIAAL
jgi:hypothetical protein